MRDRNATVANSMGGKHGSFLWRPSLAKEVQDWELILCYISLICSVLLINVQP